MNRRDFLERAAKAMLLMAGATLVKCGSDDNIFTSVTDDTGHTHTFILPTDAIQDPTKSFTDYTSTTKSHYHQLTLTTEDLTSLAKGTIVTKTTTTVSEHTHQFKLSR